MEEMKFYFTDVEKEIQLLSKNLGPKKLGEERGEGKNSVGLSCLIFLCTRSET